MMQYVNCFLSFLVGNIRVGNLWLTYLDVLTWDVVSFTAGNFLKAGFISGLAGVGKELLHTRGKLQIEAYQMSAPQGELTAHPRGYGHNLKLEVGG